MSFSPMFHYINTYHMEKVQAPQPFALLSEKSIIIISSLNFVQKEKIIMNNVLDQSLTTTAILFWSTKVELATLRCFRFSLLQSSRHPIRSVTVALVRPLTVRSVTL